MVRQNGDLRFPSSGQQWRLKVMSLVILTLGSACAGRDDELTYEGGGDDDQGGTGAQTGAAGTGGSEIGATGAGGSGTEGVAMNSAGGASSSGGAVASGSGGDADGPVSGAGGVWAAGGAEQSGSGGGPVVRPGDPAMGSHDGDGTGCAEDQILDACGICEGDGSSCDCYEGEVCAQIVLQHNEVRRELNLGLFSNQPVPDPPLKMVGWDPLIAQKAQEYADGMDDWSDGHSSQQFRTYQSTHHDGYHGENLAVGGGAYGDPRSFVYEGWCLSEAQGCTLKECGGHYTQVAWRESIWIGCGQKEDLPFEVDGKIYTGLLTVCQYGPGGNNGSDPY